MTEKKEVNSVIMPPSVIRNVRKRNNGRQFMLFRTDDRNLSAKKKLEVKPYNLDEFSEPVINNFRRWPRGSASGAMTRKCDSLLPIELKPENVNTGFLAFFLTGRKKYFKIGSGPN